MMLGALERAWLRARIVWMEVRSACALSEARDLHKQGLDHTDQYAQRLDEIETFDAAIDKCMQRINESQPKRSFVRQCAGPCDQGRQQCRTPDLCRTTAPVFHQVLVAALLIFLALAFFPRA